MIIKALELTDFRNYESLNIEFDRGINILYGDNAQGKTNILESIYLSGTTKSHKGSKDKHMIRFGCHESHIRTYVEKREVDYKIDLHLRKNKNKIIGINAIPIKKASELLGLTQLVFFSPEDLNIIKNGPSERRRFIDIELCQLDKLYLYNLTKFNRIVMQRNKLLKDIFFHTEGLDTLDIWDEQLLHYGIKVIERRERFAEELNEIIYDIHQKLSGRTEELRVRYEPDTDRNSFPDKLKRSRESDLKQKTTTVGPHRDDLSFIAGSIDIRNFGSQGQQRTAALSLKLSEIELVKKISQDSPILLLDDVLSELDGKRQNYLLDNIGDIQTIITCTGLDKFVEKRFHVNKIYKVISGTVVSEN